MIKTRSIIMVLFVAMCMTLLSLIAAQTASSNQGRSFSLPQHGTLSLDVPDVWKCKVSQPEGDLPPTITFYPETGDEFKVLITPLWSPKKDPHFNKSDNIRSLIDRELRGMLPGAVEQSVAIQEFKGGYSTGYYFLVTDRAPKPGDYSYAVRAGSGVGDLLLSVTVLSRSKNSTGISSTIKALKTAKHIYK